MLISLNIFLGHQFIGNERATLRHPLKLADENCVCLVAKERMGFFKLNNFTLLTRIYWTVVFVILIKERSHQRAVKTQAMLWYASERGGIT